MVENTITCVKDRLVAKTSGQKSLSAVVKNRKNSMTSKFIIKTATLAACLVVGGIVSANAAMTLTVSETGQTTQTFTDGGSGLITVIGGSIDSWSLLQLVGEYNPGSSPDLDLNFDLKANSASLNSLTLTLTETGVTVPFAIGQLVFSAGGADGTSTIAPIAQLNGVQVASLGPYVNKSSWSGGTESVTESLSPSGFNITEQVVISTSTKNSQPGGDLSLEVVPEASTMIAGALLILPFGASTLRILRRRSMA